MATREELWMVPGIISEPGRMRTWTKADVASRFFGRPITPQGGNIAAPGAHLRKMLSAQAPFQGDLVRLAMLRPHVYGGITYRTLESIDGQAGQFGGFGYASLGDFEFLPQEIVNARDRIGTCNSHAAQFVDLAHIAGSWESTVHGLPGSPEKSALEAELGSMQSGINERIRRVVGRWNQIPSYFMGGKDPCGSGQSDFINELVGLVDALLEYNRAAEAGVQNVTAAVQARTNAAAAVEQAKAEAAQTSVRQQQAATTAAATAVVRSKAEQTALLLQQAQLQAQLNEATTPKIFGLPVGTAAGIGAALVGAVVLIVALK